MRILDVHDIFDGFVASKVVFNGEEYFWKGPIPKLCSIFRT